MVNKLPSNFGARVVSAIVIAGPALVAIEFGAPFFNIFISLLGALMAWEWSKLCLEDEFKLPGILLALFSAAIPMLPLLGLGLVEAILIAPVICTLLFALSFSKGGKLYFAIGAIYLALPLASFIFLRNTDGIGVQLVYWLALTVVATDTGGYGFGLTIGGPKLAPRISPKKTWAGLLGGMLCASLVGLILANLFDWQAPVIVALISAALAFIAQVGDLFESHVKRHFDVKDSSNIIPGHGGVLDRMDGMISAGAAFAGLILATNGQILSWF
ncbi:phosphatidate cytidylyltransferase [Terasakiella sp. SH-1]|uniref:phosphatidate cytidylyltransferase n=1 Tax=Terasakiella sp. SH-1 TaxID=2560057 RepID=UPI00107426B9|nr:phosphatidate cytidylyltransferase [Terasakiella sp. SH-1]